MTGITLYDGYQLPYFDGQEALADLLEHAEGTQHQEDAHKLAMSVSGGYGRTLVMTSGFFVDRFRDAPIGKLLSVQSITLKAPAGGMAKALFQPAPSEQWGRR